MASLRAQQDRERAGNAATRIADFLVTGGVFPYGSYPYTSPYEDITIKSA